MPALGTDSNVSARPPPRLLVRVLPCTFWFAVPIGPGSRVRDLVDLHGAVADALDLRGRSRSCLELRFCAGAGAKPAEEDVQMKSASGPPLPCLSRPVPNDATLVDGAHVVGTLNYNNCPFFWSVDTFSVAGWRKLLFGESLDPPPGLAIEYAADTELQQPLQRFAGTGNDNDGEDSESLLFGGKPAGVHLPAAPVAKPKLLDCYLVAFPKLLYMLRWAERQPNGPLLYSVYHSSTPMGNINAANFRWTSNDADAERAFSFWLAHAAHALALEIGGFLAWTLRAMSNVSIARALDGSNLGLVIAAYDLFIIALYFPLEAVWRKNNPAEAAAEAASKRGEVVVDEMAAKEIGDKDAGSEDAAVVAEQVQPPPASARSLDAV
ncbi:hypothetical protein DFJ74DRAFT_714305 [Hyaloraphidium curvatum]|nr:hypothetical protein DFJ74DRAFT_714305 [Hyaloraphidium curvatum]